MQVNLKIASCSSETGALLKEYLEDRGLTINPLSPIDICYGVRSSKAKRLNGLAGGGDKVGNMVKMEAGGVRLVPWFSGSNVPIGFKFPALARNTTGHGGTDIVPVFQAQEIPWRIAAGFSWFSSYVPMVTEYRVWNFRGETLDVYEKVMNRPEDYKYVAGRNFRNGFDFQKIDFNPRNPIYQKIHNEARKAVRALGFDFGAVDMLWGTDGEPYTLECNTAPGVLKSGAQATLGKLADRMVEWVNDGCPEKGY